MIEAGLSPNTTVAFSSPDLNAMCQTKASLPRVGDSGVFVVCPNGDVTELPSWKNEGMEAIGIEVRSNSNGYSDPGYLIAISANGSSGAR